MKYRSLVGSLLYAATITRPDIAFTVGRLCQHVSEPCKHHMNSAKRVLRYLHGTSDLCMVFGQTPIEHSPLKPVIDMKSIQILIMAVRRVTARAHLDVLFDLMEM